MLELESTLSRHSVCQFSAKLDNFYFFDPNLLKMDLGSEIQKNVGIRISIVKIPCAPISGKTYNFEFFDPNLPKNGFWGQFFKNLNLDSESACLRFHVYQFSDIRDNFEFLGSKF